MKTPLLLVLVFILFPHVAFAQSSGNAAPSRKHTRRTAIITSHSALPILTSGPQKIVIEYINPLHFQYSLQVSSTNVSAPTPPASIAPSASTAGISPPAPAAMRTPSPQPAPAKVKEQWQNILTNLKAVRDLAFVRKQQTDTALFLASTEEQCYKDRLALYSSFLLDEKSAESLKQFVEKNRKPVTAAASNSATDSCRRADNEWPFSSLQDTEKQIYVLQENIFDLASAPGFAAWKAIAPNGDNYSAVTSLAANLLTQVQTLETTSDVAKNFEAAQVYNRFWRARIEDIARADDQIAQAKTELAKADAALKQNATDSSAKTAYSKASDAYLAASQKNPFMYTLYVDCSTNWYGRGRTDTITLHYTDISASSSADQTAQIAISSCLTPGTVSTGMGMSFLRNQQFGFVSGRDPNNPTNIISTVGATTDQQVTPLYALQYNIAIRDFSDGLGLHGAVGAALGSSSGTANIELIAGPAISIRRRAFFITPAFQLARRDQLLPGFKVGDPQSTLTAVPTHTGWQPGFALTFTFSVAQ